MTHPCQTLVDQIHADLQTAPTPAEEMSFHYPDWETKLTITVELLNGTRTYILNVVGETVYFHRAMHAPKCIAEIGIGMEVFLKSHFIEV